MPGRYSRKTADTAWTCCAPNSSASTTKSHHAATTYWSAVQRQQHIAAIQEQLDRAERLISKVEEDRARERAEGLEE